MFTLSLCEVFFCLESMYQQLMSSLSFLTVILQNMTLNSRTVIICMDGAQTMAGKKKGLEALIKSSPNGQWIAIKTAYGIIAQKLPVTFLNCGDISDHLLVFTVYNGELSFKVMRIFTRSLQHMEDTRTSAFLITAEN